MKDLSVILYFNTFDLILKNFVFKFVDLINKKKFT